MKEKAKCKVKATLPRQGKLYFEFEYKGRDYQVKALDFQTTDQPKDLNVIIDDAVAYQDPEFYLPLIYHPGDSVEMKITGDVKSFVTPVLDTVNDIAHRIKIPADFRLKRFDTVTCIVREIKDGKVEFEPVRPMRRERRENIDMSRLLSLIPLDDDQRLFVTDHFDRLPVFATARDLLQENDPNWVLSALDATTRQLPVWLNDNISRYDLELTWLKKLASLCIALIETQDFVVLFPEQQRQDVTKRLAGIITMTDDYREAIYLAVNIEEARQYVDTALDVLANSGFLYNSYKRLRIIQSLFDLRPVLADEAMVKILAMLLKKHAIKGFMDKYTPFCQVAIENYVERHDRRGVMANREEIGNMVKAIAVLLLMSPRGEYPDWDRYYAMLYRYAALYMHASRDICKSLLMRAQDILFRGVEIPVSFTWDTLDNLTFLCSVLLLKNPERPGPNPGAVDMGNVTVLLQGGSLAIECSDGSDNEYNAFNPKLFPDQDIRVTLPSKISGKVAIGEKSVPKLSRMWEQIAEAIEKASQIRERKAAAEIKLEAGDETEVIVTKIDGEEKKLFCRIVEEGVKGSGTMDFSEVSGVDYTRLEPSQFRGENDRPLIIPVKVKTVSESGRYEFSAVTLMKDHIEQMARDMQRDGEEVLAYFDRKSDRGKCYGFTEYGFRFIFDDESVRDIDFDPDEHAECVVTIKYVKRNDIREYGNDNVICYARLERVTGNVPQYWESIRDMTSNLLMSYTEGEEYDKEDESDDDIRESGETDRQLSPEYAVEAMRLLSVMAYENNGNYDLPFNYLGAARILSDLTGRTGDSDRLDLRMRMTESISGFAEETRIDRRGIKELISEAEKVEKTDISVRNLNTILIALEALGQPGSESETLWKRLDNSRDSQADVLLRQVMAFNILAGVKESGTERHNLKKSIYETARLPLTQRSMNLLGQEDMNTEYKASLVYPNTKEGRMQPDPVLQGDKVMRVVASFLNTDGGVLFIGVNDSQSVCGLHNDFVFLNDNYENYDEEAIKDTFRVTFIRAMRRFFGTLNDGVNLAEKHVKGDFDYEDGKCYFKVTVLKADWPVLSADGRLFLRVDNNSVEEADEKAKADFIRRRTATNMVSSGTTMSSTF